MWLVAGGARVLEVEDFLPEGYRIGGNVYNAGGNVQRSREPLREQGLNARQRRCECLRKAAPHVYRQVWQKARSWGCGGVWGGVGQAVKAVADVPCLPPRRRHV